MSHANDLVPGSIATGNESECLNDQCNPTDNATSADSFFTSALKTLIPNLMGEVSINDYSNDSAICLSSRLILKNADGDSFVKSLNSDNKVITVPVIIGKQQEDLVEILTPLSEGIQIIDRGKSTVLEGQKVKVISDKNS